MKLLIWCLKVCDCNFATSKSIKTPIKMKKFLSLILVMMTFAFHAIAGESKTSTSPSQGIMLEIVQFKETSGRHRAPMRVSIEAWYNAESNTIDITYDGETEGEVFLCLNGNILDYSPEINSSIMLPHSSGLYTIEIVSETWSAKGDIRLV